VTVGELLTQLASQNPDTPVQLITYDEFSSGPAVNLCGWERAVNGDGVTIKLWGEA
jgi:hypothetical protein